MAIQPGHADKIRIAGAATTALGKQHQRHLPLPGQLQQPVGLLVVHHPLGAGKHGVVVAHRHDPRGRLTKLFGINGAGAANQTICRAHGLQFFTAAATTLGGQRHGAVFLEAVGIQQVVQVFPCRALALAVAFLHRLRPARITDGLMPIQYLGQVLADMVQVHAFFRGDGIALHLTRLHKQQWRCFIEGIALPGRQTMHTPRHRGTHFEFHFHGFQHGHHLALLHGGAGLHQ